MIAILPAGEAEKQELLSSAGIHKPATCLTAKDGPERLGYVLYHREGERVEILHVQATDARLADGLLRAALNAAMGEGALYAFCANPSCFPFLRPLGFRPDGRAALGNGDLPEDGAAVSPGESLGILIGEIFAGGCCSGKKQRQ